MGFSGCNTAVKKVVR